MRRFLARAFADQSLKEQESLIVGVVDEFMDQIGKRSREDGFVDLTKWFNLLTFDIIGLLAFGRDFQGVHTGECVFFASFLPRLERKPNVF
jgi:cytochrome P450